MWIIPSQLLKCAPDMEALDLDSKTSLENECEPSHIVNSRGSLKPISSVKWRRDSWMSHLFGTILKPSHTDRFTDWWTSSLRVTHVSHFQPLESEQEKKTQDISGLGLQMEFGFSDQECAFLRMSKDTSASDSAKSLQNWKALVIKRRGEYSARRSMRERLTSASGCLSWPTIRASEYKDVGPVGSKSHDHMLGKGYLCAVVTKEASNWPTAQVTDAMGACLTEKRLSGPKGTQLREAVHGLPAPANPSTDGSRQESWGTPRCSMAQDKQEDSGKHRLGEQIQHGTTGKLNPRWVETLMGLPVGWTMPSCMSPLTIVPTNCASSATELCQQQQSEHSELFGRNSQND